MCAPIGLLRCSYDVLQDRCCDLPASDQHELQGQDPASPTINGSQLDQTEEWSPYPKIPAALRKDQYVSTSEADRPLLWPPVNIFHDGHLKYHKSYKGPRPISYVDTGAYVGGKRDYYEAFNKEELCWIRRIDHLLEFHGVARYLHARGKYVDPEDY